MTYEVLREGAAYEIGRRDGNLIAACSCGFGATYPDKGIGRAYMAAWESRHVGCMPQNGTETALGAAESPSRVSAVIREGESA